MCTLRFLEKSFLFVAEFSKKNAKNRPKEQIILHVLPQKLKIVEMQKLAQTKPMDDELLSCMASTQAELLSLLTYFPACVDWAVGR